MQVGLQTRSTHTRTPAMFSTTKIVGSLYVLNCTSCKLGSKRITPWTDFLSSLPRLTSSQSPAPSIRRRLQGQCVYCVLCVCVCCVCLFLFTLPTRRQSPAPSIRRRLQGQCVLCVLCVCSCSLCRPEDSHPHPAYDAGCRDSVCVVCVCVCVLCVVCVCVCVCVVCCVCVLVHFADQKPVTCTQHTTQAAGAVCALCVVCVFLFTLPTRSQLPAPSMRRRLQGQCVRCVCVCVCVCVVCVVFFFLFTLPTRSQSPAPSIRRRLQGQRVLSECMRPYCDLLK
jgi:hypothetical protein